MHDKILNGACHTVILLYASTKEVGIYMLYTVQCSYLFCLFYDTPPLHYLYSLYDN